MRIFKPKLDKSYYKTGLNHKQQKQVSSTIKTLSKQLSDRYKEIDALKKQISKEGIDTLKAELEKERLKTKRQKERAELAEFRYEKLKNKIFQHEPLFFEKYLRS